MVGHNRWSCVRTARLYLSGGFCSVEAPKNANRQSLESLTERHLTRSRQLNGVVPEMNPVLLELVRVEQSSKQVCNTLWRTLMAPSSLNFSSWGLLCLTQGLAKSHYVVLAHLNNGTVVGLERKISGRCWHSRQGGLEHSRWTGSLLGI